MKTTSKINMISKIKRTSKKKKSSTIKKTAKTSNPPKSQAWMKKRLCEDKPAWRQIALSQTTHGAGHILLCGIFLYWSWLALNISACLGLSAWQTFDTILSDLKWINIQDDKGHFKRVFCKSSVMINKNRHSNLLNSFSCGRLFHSKPTVSCWHSKFASSMMCGSTFKIRFFYVFT